MDSILVEQIEELEDMTIRELRSKYRELFKEDPRSFNKQFYIKRIAWRLQSIEKGGLTERARRRAKRIADENDLRLTAPKVKEVEEVSQPPAPIQGHHDSRIPIPGSIITREYKGQTIRVVVLEDGFRYKDEKYSTLTAVAKAATGGHWNGYKFFGL